jgi:hypothetical protein
VQEESDIRDDIAIDASSCISSASCLKSSLDGMGMTSSRANEDIHPGRRLTRRETDRWSSSTFGCPPHSGLPFW